MNHDQRTRQRQAARANQQRREQLILVFGKADPPTIKRPETKTEEK